MRHSNWTGRPIVQTLESRTLLCGVSPASAAPELAPPAPFGPIGPEVSVGHGHDPSVATDAAGNYVVAWIGQDNTGPGVFARRFTAIGEPAGEQFRVADPVGGAIKFASVAMNGAGESVVGWGTEWAAGVTVSARRYVASGDPVGDEFAVSAQTAGDLAVDIDDDGNSIFVWTGGQSVGVWAARYDAAGHPIGDEFRVNETTLGSESSPSVATDAEGDFVVAWHSRTPPAGCVVCDPDPDGPLPPPDADVFATRFDSTGSVAGDEFRVNTTTAGQQVDPSVDMDADGNFVIAWDDQNWDEVQGHRGIYAQGFNGAGEPAGTEFTVSPAGSDHAPVVSMDARGDFIVGFAGFAGYWGVPPLPQPPRSCIQRFTAAGQSVGELIRFAGTLSVAAQAGGGFVAAFNWMNMHARRYGYLPPQVTAVFVGSTAWTPAFSDALQAQGLGDATFGYEIPSGPEQLAVLPWNNLDTINVRFSQDLNPSHARPSVTGLTAGDYPVAGFAYDGETHTATWTLAQPIANDRVQIRLERDVDLNPSVPSWWWLAAPTPDVELDGEWSSGSSDFPSGDGLPGGDFLFSINVLPGDADRDGVVLADDFAAVKQRFFATPSGPSYSIFQDIDGSGSILAADFSAVKANFFRRLPEQGSINGSGLPWWMYGGGWR